MKKLIIYFLFLIISVNFTGCSSWSANNENTYTLEENTDSREENSSKEQNISEETVSGQNVEEYASDEDIMETAETVSAPEVSQGEENAGNNENSKKVIVIDPGHAAHSNLEKEEQSPGSGIMKIKDGGGAQGNTTGTPEYVVNMNVAVKLKDLLEAENYTVIMTKNSNDVSLGNIERAEVGNENNASLVIRIHCDSADNSNAHGASILVPSRTGYAESICDVSRQYGEIVLNSLVETVHMNNRGISVRDDMTGFNWSKVPVILVEMGFMSNPEEDKLLSEESYQNKLAQGLYNGIVNCMR